MGNTIINSVKYNNQVKELKKILYSLIENQVSSIWLIKESLIRIRNLLREFYPILSGKQPAETEREKDRVRNFWSIIAQLKRRIAKVEKDNLYEKVLIDRKSLKRIKDKSNDSGVLLTKFWIFYDIFSSDGSRYETVDGFIRLSRFSIFKIV